nr:hypothetical protein [Sporomusa acidovorans]
MNASCTVESEDTKVAKLMRGEQSEEYMKHGYQIVKRFTYLRR